MISFGPFQLLPRERRLLKDRQPLEVGSRSLEILLALVERAGEVVSKRALIARVWPDLVVEESSLRAHIAALRKVLGDGADGARYVMNVPGRGYCFVAPVTRTEPQNGTSPPAPTPINQPLRLPARLDRMIGRDDFVADLCTQTLVQRFVSIVGPGGMGKTTVAIAVAYELAERFQNAVYFVDLGSVGDPSLVMSAVATALGLSADANDPLAHVHAFLERKRCVLILDSCEHLIAPVAALAESIYIAASQAHILATSRESLRVEGEHVHLLTPLGAPDPEADSGLTAAGALTFPAVRLFVERAAAGGNAIAFSDAEAPVVAGICRKLDGIALALELAAGRVAVHGIHGIARLLESRFKLAWQGRRTALPRHQTLNAMLDWSYNLLDGEEQCCLRRLSVFVGPFSLQAAQLIQGPDCEPGRTAEILGNLAAKSLVSVRPDDGLAMYRLLDTTRSHVAERLAQSEEANTIARRHAMYSLNRLREKSDSREETADLANVRAALEWCFSGSGDAELGRDLVMAVTSFLLRRSMLSECFYWSSRAIETLPQAEADTMRDLALREAQAISAMFTQGNDKRVQGAIQHCVDLAARLNATARLRELLVGLTVFSIRTGDFQGALRAAKRSEELSRKFPDPSIRVVADWQLCSAHHMIGDQLEAQRCGQRAFDLEASLHEASTQLFGHDFHILGLVGLARTLWLRGFADRSVQFVRQAIEDAARLRQPLSVCMSLIYATTVHLWRGDLKAAECDLLQGIKEAQKHSLGPYRALTLGLQGELAFRSGDSCGGLILLRDALEQLAKAQYLLLVPQFVAALAEALAMRDESDRALTLIEQAIAQRERSGASFDLPEMLRIKAQILSGAARADHDSAQQCLMRSLQLAREQSALSWELRSALSWVRLQPDNTSARDLLRAVRDRFVEGFDTPDLVLARQLLESHALG